MFLVILYNWLGGFKWRYWDMFAIFRNFFRHKRITVSHLLCVKKHIMVKQYHNHLPLSVDFFNNFENVVHETSQSVLYCFVSQCFSLINQSRHKT